MDTSTSRRLWHLLEPVHAVAYFASEAIDALKDLGLKGFWMGYFAGRAAPMGTVPPEVVDATFFNFHPSLVHRALPDAWGYASPGDVLAARLDAVDVVLRKALGDDAVTGDEVAEAAELAEAAARACPVGGRTLFAAHAALPWPHPVHLRLWHAATLIREHRGDGHVAACLAAGLDGLAAHVTVAAGGAVPRDHLQKARAWSDDDWDAAADRLRHAGLLDADGRLTADGVATRRQVEETTDRLAVDPWDHLGPQRTARLAELLRPLALATQAVMPFPNPIGLPRLEA